MKRLKQLISVFSMPDGVVRDRFGDHWIHVSPYELDGGNEYPFNYQRMSVNWFGFWTKESEWLSKNTPLINCI